MEKHVLLCRKYNENVNYDGGGPTPLAYHLTAKHKKLMQYLANMLRLSTYFLSIDHGY